MLLRWLAALAALSTFATATPAQVPAPLTNDIESESSPPAEVPSLPNGEDGPVLLTKADVDAWLDGFMPYGIARGDIAGAVVVVVKDGAILTEKGFGYSDVEAGTPVDPDRTLFRPGSVSKLFTWTAVMQLVEQGRLDLDTDVNEYLDFEIPAYDGQPVTLRNIMTHTAGFEESVRYLMYADSGSIMPLGELMERSLPARIFAPGTTPAYSNYATALAGYIVERVSGEPFDNYVERHIFAPLGMRNSTFRQPLPERLEGQMSKGYASAAGEEQDFELVGPAPAGSLSSTGTDMARFMIAHLNEGGPLLSPATARRMHNTSLEILPPLNRMALGFYEQQFGDVRGIGHGGDTQYFHSDLMLFPEQDVGIFVSFNSAGKAGVTGPLRSSLVEQFAERYFGSPPLGTERVDAETAKAHARAMVGTYASSRGFKTNFLAAMNLAGQSKVGLSPDGGLLIQGATNTSGAPREWVEVSPWVWRDKVSGERLAARVVDGKVDRWSFDSVAPVMMYDRVPWYLNGSWLMPVVLASLAIVTLTALAWPAGAIARRRYRAPHPFSGARLRSYRVVRAFSWAALLVLAGWVVFVTTAFGNLKLFGGALDPLLLILQVLTPLILVGLFGLAVYNAVLVWRRDASGWFAKLWSVLLVLAALTLAYIAFAFGLVGLGTTY